MSSLQSALSILYVLSILILIVHVYHQDYRLKTRGPYIMLATVTCSAIGFTFVFNNSEVSYGLGLILSLVSQLLTLSIISKFNKNPLGINTQILTSLLVIVSTSFIFSYIATQNAYGEVVNQNITFSIEYIAYLISYTGLFATNLYYIIQGKKTNNSITKLKEIYLKIGYLISFMPTIIIGLFAYFININKDLLLINFYFLGVFLILSLLALFHSKLFDFDKVVPTIIKSILIATVPLIVYYVVFFIDASLFANYSRIEVLALNLLIFSIIVFIASLLYKNSKLIVRNIRSVPNSFSVQKDNFLEDIKEELRLDSLFEILTSALKKEINPKEISLYIANTSEHTLIYSSQEEQEKEAEEITGTAWYIKQLDFYDIILQDETLRSQLISKYKNFKNTYELIDSKEAEVLIPFRINDDHTGLLFLGRKKSKKAYTVQDFSLISSLVSNLSLASGRAILYEEVDTFNKTLQIEVEEATKDMQASISQLEEAYRKEKDMIDILSHELRTPLSIARNAVMLIQSSKKKRKLTHEKLDNYVIKAVVHLQKEITLLERMLSSTKIETNELTIAPAKVNLKDAIEEIIILYKKEIEDKKLDLNIKIPAKTFVLADIKHLKEVVDNLVGNAVKYTTEGTISIKSSKLNKTVKLQIADTGVGIAKEHIPHLGKKFYRADTYVKKETDLDNLNIVRPGGTGLGLYVTYGLVKLMGWQIKVASKLGKGTTFTVTIPLFLQEKG